MQHRISRLLVPLLLAASCDDSHWSRTPTQPTLVNHASSLVSVNSTSLVSISTTSSVAVAQPVVTSICPAVAPFNVSFVLVVQPFTVEDVVVTTIRAQFFDTTGSAMPQVTLPAPVPTTQFGTALVNARSQTFPVTLGIGCGTGRTGTVRIVVDTRDERGRRESSQATLDVR